MCARERRRKARRPQPHRLLTVRTLLPRSQYSTWPKAAAENFAAVQRAQAGYVEPKIGSEGTGAGAARGEAVAEELLTGNARYVAEQREAAQSMVTRAQGILIEPAAVVLSLTALPADVHTLLGCSESALFVVPCTPAGIEPLAIGNVEYGAISLKAKCLLIVAAPTPELCARSPAHPPTRCAAARMRRRRRAYAPPPTLPPSSPAAAAVATGRRAPPAPA
jgi:hypothetical protein